MARTLKKENYDKVYIPGRRQTSVRNPRTGRYTHVYRVRNIHNGKCYYSAIKNDKLFWANPVRCLEGANLRRNNITKAFAAEIRRVGAKNFTIESLFVSAEPSESYTFLSKLRSQPDYFNGYNVKFTRKMKSEDRIKEFEDGTVKYIVDSYGTLRASLYFHDETQLERDKAIMKKVIEVADIYDDRPELKDLAIQKAILTRKSYPHKQ